MSSSDCIVTKFLLIVRAIFITLVLLFVFASKTSSSPVISQLKNIRFSSDKEKTRIVLDLSGLIDFKEQITNNLDIFLVELPKCQNISQQKSIKPSNGLVNTINIKEKNGDNLCIEIFLGKNAGSYNVFSIKADKDKPHRLVLDFFSLNNKPPKARSLVELKQIKRKRIIVIDPGHGGDDPGAIGYNGLKEKDIVLKIGKELKDLINKTMPNTQAYLTREKDYFIPLQQRVKIAHQYKADLFISLHLNASRKKYIQGASVFYLSETGASDKASELLAARENASDLIGGINFSKDKILNTILIDLVQTYTINESIRLSQSMLDGLLKVDFQNQGIKCANFAVLKSPSIPSVLLEIGFITNICDAKKINDPSYQKNITQQIAKSLTSYLESNKEQPASLPSSKISQVNTASGL